MRLWQREWLAVRRRRPFLLTRLERFYSVRASSLAEAGHPHRGPGGTQKTGATMLLVLAVVVLVAAVFALPEVRGWMGEKTTSVGMWPSLDAEIYGRTIRWREVHTA